MADGGDRAARAALSLGSLLAGLAMNLSDCGADHALGHALGGRLGLPHGLSVGLVLAETLDVDRAACPERLERVADALGEPAAAGRRLPRRAGGAPPAGGDRLPHAAPQAGVRGGTWTAWSRSPLDDYCLTVSPHAWTDATSAGAYANALALGTSRVVLQQIVVRFARPRDRCEGNSV